LQEEQRLTEQVFSWESQLDGLGLKSENYIKSADVLP
jgi:hypothetical protein